GFVGCVKIAGHVKIADSVKSPAMALRPRCFPRERGNALFRPGRSVSCRKVLHRKVLYGKVSYVNLRLLRMFSRGNCDSVLCDTVIVSRGKVLLVQATKLIFRENPEYFYY